MGNDQPFRISLLTHRATVTGRFSRCASTSGPLSPVLSEFCPDVDLPTLLGTDVLLGKPFSGPLPCLIEETGRSGANPEGSKSRVHVD